MWTFLLHIVALSHFLFTLCYDWFYIIPPHDAADSAVPWFKPHKFKYLTFWDVVLQTIFFAICVIADLVAKDDTKHALRQLQNRLMVSLAFPLAMFVGVTFWSIYLVDRELILPKALDVFFPVWMNHCMHTNIVIFILIEFLTSNYTHNPRSRNVKILLSVMITYLVWLILIYIVTDVWVYPILHVLPWPFKIVFFIGCLGLALGLYFFGEKLNQKLRGNRAVDLEDDAVATVSASGGSSSLPSGPKKEKKKKRSL